MLNWAYVPYTLPLILSGTAALVLSLYAARHHEVRGAPAFAGYCLAAFVWCFAYAFEIASADLQIKLAWAKVEYLGITYGPLCWLAFAVFYTRRDRWANTRLFAVLSLIPFTTLVLAFTNEAHGLIWSHTSLDSSGVFPTLYLQYGSWFWVHTIFSYVCALGGSVLLLTGLVQGREFYQRQRMALLFAVLVTWAGNLLYIAKLSPIPGLDLTPFAAVVTALAVALALFSFRLLDLVPVARRVLLDSMGDAVIALDPQNRILDLNRSASLIIGVSSTAAIGQPARQFLGNHIDLVERYRDVREASTEISRETSSGTRYFELQITPLRDVVGEFSGRLITLHDVTERKQAEAEIRQLNESLEQRIKERTSQLEIANQSLQNEISERMRAESERELLMSQLEAQHTLLETVINSAPVGIILYDRDMRVLGVNSEYARLTRTETGKLRDQVLYEVAPGPSLSKEVHDRVLAGEAVNQEDVRYESPFGEVRYYDFRFRPVRDDSGEVKAVVGTAMDVTARHEVDEQREEFIALASHELRTPVTSIKGFAKISLPAAARSGDQRLVRSLRIINDQADRIARLIEELLDVSRVRRQALPLWLESLDFCTVVSDVISSAKLTSPQFDFDLQIPEGPLPVRADRQRIEEVLTNLLQNAVKYSGDSRHIEIAVTCQDGEVVTSVRDFGVGIPAREQPRIFERFFRATNVSSPKHTGLGLGLYISKSIISRHDGRMWVESAVGEGSTFYFSIPLEK